MAEFMQHHIDKLDKQKILGLYRSRNSISERSNAKWMCNNQTFLSFMNNDYLGLAKHPEVIHALLEGTAHYGVGSSASQLLGGYYAIHEKLEEKLAEFLGFERTLIFSSGFMANLAVLTTLIHKNNCVFEDRLNHASLIDGVRYSKAAVKRYNRNNIVQLEKRILQTNSAVKWIVSEGLFSMDGDIAPLPQLFHLAKIHKCQILIDDAHGIGVLGKNGRGSMEHFQLPIEELSVLVGTFGKAFGTMGAFVACSHILIETLLQFARSFIYTTALPPSIASATYKSLQLIQTESWRREHLQLLIQYFKKSAEDLNLPLSPSITPIQTLIIGNTEKTLEVTELLKNKGILVGCIRPPTIPPNTSRLRINLNVHHTKHDVDFLLESLSTIWERHIVNELYI